MVFANNLSLVSLLITMIAILLVVIVVLVNFLLRSRKRERELASHDSLTDLLNRNAFMEHSGAENSRSSRNGRPFTMAYLDCDNFKGINDSLGHLTGDAVLKVIAETMQSTTRNYDVVARMGGDEFAILLPETSVDSARAVIDRLHAKLCEAMQRHEWPVTFSVGVYTFCEPSESVDEMVQRVDALMYSVKRSGKSGVNYSAETVASERF